MMQKPYKAAVGSFILLFALIALLDWTKRSKAPESIENQVEESSTAMSDDGPQHTNPLRAPIPFPKDSVLTQLRLAADPGTFLLTVRHLPGVEKAEFDTRSSTLAITHRTSGPGAKEVAELAGQAGLTVQGEVMDLPLKLPNPHLDTCGSCGFEIYEKLRKKDGVRAVEVFLPVKKQLRLLVEPESVTPSEVDRFFTESLQATHHSP